MDDSPDDSEHDDVPLGNNLGAGVQVSKEDHGLGRMDLLPGAQGLSDHQSGLSLKAFVK